MPGQSESSATRERLDELRQRLYRPDVSEEDRQEYAGLIAHLQPAEQPPSRPAPGAPAPQRTARRLRRPLAIGIVGAAVVVLAVVATLTARTLSPSTVTPTTPVWSSAADQTAAPPPTPVTLAYGSRSIAAQQTSGGGSAVVWLRLGSAPRTGGRLAVAVSSSDPAPIGWQAERFRNGSQGTSPLEVVATSAPALREGAAAPTVVAYSGTPPSQVVVRAPVGTGWSITVAFLR